MSDYQKSLDNISSTVSDTAKKTALLPVNIAKDTVKNGVKSASSKANPIAKPINKNDVTDTGTESLKFAYKIGKDAKGAGEAVKTTAKATVKATKATVKTTKATVKTAKKTAKETAKVAKETAKTTVKATKATAKAAYRAVQITVKAVVKITEVTVKIVSEVIGAIAANPYVALVILIIACVVVLCIGIVSLLGAITGGVASNANGYTQMSTQEQYALDAYNRANEYYNIAVANEKNEFYSTRIDDLVFDSNNLSTSDLVYMERTKPEPKVIYQTSFATSAQKNTLKDSLNNGIIPAKEAIAIAYVFLQKENNKANGTENLIYVTEFTQDVFDSLIYKAINHRKMIYTGQYCGGTCTRTVDYVPNEPYYSQAETAMISANNAYEELKEIVELIEYNKKIPNGASQTAHWNNNISEKVDRWNQTHGIIYQEKYNTKEIEGYDYEETFTVVETVMYDCQDKFAQTPQYIEVEHLSCSYQHNLHSIGLSLLTADDLMTALDFTEYERVWVEYTMLGFNELGIQ